MGRRKVCTLNQKHTKVTETLVCFFCSGLCAVRSFELSCSRRCYRRKCYRHRYCRHRNCCRSYCRDSCWFRRCSRKSRPAVRAQPVQLLHCTAGCAHGNHAPCKAGRIPPQGVQRENSPLSWPGHPPSLPPNTGWKDPQERNRELLTGGPALPRAPLGPGAPTLPWRRAQRP